jgi:ribosomal protein S18 acetylase RimI-like enzyme
MKHWIQYRYMQSGEELEICALIIRVFSEFIAHQYSDQDIQGFLKYIQPRSLSKRFQEDSSVLVAATQEKIVGMIELVGNSHISLLFVDGHLQRIGIGKELLKKSLKICRRKNPALKEITVNSSPNAVNIYKKIAFSVIDSEKEKNNIRFVAMNPEISNSVDTLSAQL